MNNIHILPTDNPSRLHLWTDEKSTRLELCELEYSHTRNTQNIYITSDEEIKEGDWGYSEMDGIGTWCGPILKHEGFPKKIILTTDQDLIKDGVQAIDDDFLEWFVKNPNCERVEVIKTFEDYTIVGGKSDEIYYKITIPKEEPKQEIMKNIHLLPTDNKWSRLYFNINDKEFQICKTKKFLLIL
jgi:hypothetical protein